MQTLQHLCTLCLDNSRAGSSWTLLAHLTPFSVMSPCFADFITLFLKCFKRFVSTYYLYGIVGFNMTFSSMYIMCLDAINHFHLHSPLSFPSPILGPLSFSKLSLVCVYLCVCMCVCVFQYVLLGFLTKV